MAFSNNVHQTLWLAADQVFERHERGDELMSEVESAADAYSLRIAAMKRAMRRHFLPVDEAYSELYADVSVYPAEWLAGD